MDRVEIEVKLNQGRVWLLERVVAFAPDELTRPLTPSEHDPASSWSVKDHVAHLAGIERAFNAMIRRHLAGTPNPVGLPVEADGRPQTREAIMAVVHARNETWVSEHRDQALGAIVALGQATRADTLALMAGLSDEQLAQTLPGAPWADGTIGGVLAVNDDHARRHLQWIDEAFARGRGA